jgi:hypothetical protein
VLNALVAGTRSEIVVFADARQRFEPGALRALVAPFADPQVGAVSGELLLADGEGRPLERGLGSTGAARRRSGARRAASGRWWARPARSTRSAAAVRAVPGRHDPRRRVAAAADRARPATAWCSSPWRAPGTTPPGTAALEFARKVPHDLRRFQLFAREPWLLGASNPLWLQTVSHKALRLLTPLLMLLALAANLLLLQAPFYRGAAPAAARLLRGRAAGPPGCVGCACRGCRCRTRSACWPGPPSSPS